MCSTMLLKFGGSYLYLGSGANDWETCIPQYPLAASCDAAVVSRDIYVLLHQDFNVEVNIWSISMCKCNLSGTIASVN